MKWIRFCWLPRGALFRYGGLWGEKVGKCLRRKSDGSDAVGFFPPWEMVQIVDLTEESDTTELVRDDEDDPNDPPGDDLCDKCHRSDVQVVRTDPKNGDTICTLCDHENPDEWGYDNEEEIKA